MTAGSTLAILPGARPEQRLAVLLGQQPGGDLTFELREQHYAAGIGWFDQRTLVLDPAQVRGLRQALGAGTPAAEVVERAAREVPATLPFPGPGATPARRRRAIADPA